MSGTIAPELTGFPEGTPPTLSFLHPFVHPDTFYNLQVKFNDFFKNPCWYSDWNFIEFVYQFGE